MTPREAGPSRGHTVMPGVRLGSYQIEQLLGTGGMGEVYRAKDTRLGRDVAIKILSGRHPLDDDRRARFGREARVLASLNHPNIAAIFGFEDAYFEIPPGTQADPQGQSLLIMELVDGEDLSQRISRGPLPIQEALEIAAQIAAALEAAHEQGIVHRDLKPSNVKIREDGTVKVLDFGLAKALSVEGASATTDAATSPTVTGLATQPGFIIGTAAYMAPEQVRGKAADRRADVWAFGVVLYEMLSGRRAFGGDEVSDVLAAVLKETPSMDALPADTPEAVRRLLRRCLVHDRRERLADLSAARIEITDARSSEAQVAPGRAPARRRLARTTIVAAFALALAAAVGAWVLKPPPATAPPLVTRFQVELPANSTWTRMARHVIAVSPDGTRVAYVADQRLFVRAFDEFESTTIAGVIDPSEIFFSPDGQWIGFYGQGKLRKAALSGGAVNPVSTVDLPSGATWGNGSIVFGQKTGIFKVADTGGTPELLVSAEANEQLAQPSLLRRGEVLVYTRARVGMPLDDAEIVVEDGATKVRRVVARGTDGRYLPTGHLIYSRAGDLVALRFDLATLRAAGTPVVLQSGVANSAQTGTAQYGFSETGTFAYVPAVRREARLLWLDMQGGERPIPSDVRDYVFLRLSPKDGSRLAFVAEQDQGNVEIFIRDMARGITMRLTNSAGIDTAPIWTPDGKRVIYASNRDGYVTNIYWQPADGTGAAERLTSSPNVQQPYTVTPDGRTLIYPEFASNQFDIYAMALTGDRTPRALLKTQANERRPALSPDGRWMAYQSDEMGTYEIIVRPFPEVDRARHPVSVGGGANPIWSPLGNEIFYQQGAQLVRVSVTTTPRFSVGEPQVISSEALSSSASASPASYADAGFSFGIAPDAQRFIIAKPVDNRSITSQYRVVLNWFEDVKARTRAPE
jgi:eukaryotic-like serine/threonine-protein kinase